MSKNRKTTFRQRLRKTAEDRLDAMVSTMGSAAARVIDEHGTNISAELLMQLASQPKQGKSLRYQLVTALANEMEAELEKIFNQQHSLPGMEA